MIVAFLMRGWPVIGAVLVVLLQMLLAPALTIAVATPNFILAYVLVVALVCPERDTVVFAFAMGIIYDLLGSGPVGAMALVCIAFSFALSRLQRFFHNDTLFIPIVLLIAGVFLADISYGVLQIACGVDVGFLNSLIYRSLPCAVYDTVIAVVLFPLAVRVAAAFGSHVGTP